MPCILCNSPETNEIQWGNAILLHCQNCDVYYLKNIPSQAELTQYYSQNYKIKNDLAFAEFRRISRLPEQIELLDLVLEYKNINNIIDIGCDKGYFLDEARRRGLKVYGVELSDDARSYCNQIGLDVRKNLNDFDITFDCMIMNHSLEHFTNPKEQLQLNYNKLNEGGILLVRVPAFDSFWSQVMKNYWIWFQPQNHYFHFTKKSLKLLAETVGFKVLKIHHRKPNNINTRKFTNVARTTFRNLGIYQQPLKKRIGNIVENITGVEILLVAQK